jgi:2-alkyl-3-oxoalkanoate reductase
VIDACKKHGVLQLVHISSMSVIDWAGPVGNGAVSEAANLEPRPDERSAYTRAKLEAEQLVSAAAAQGLPT